MVGPECCPAFSHRTGHGRGLDGGQRFVCRRINDDEPHAAVATRTMLTIVRIGGSLVDPGGTPCRDAIATHLRRCVLPPLARGHVIVVAGGGASAQAVRDEQAAMGFDDVTAHRMAVSAMQRNGWLVLGLLARIPGVPAPRAVHGLSDVRSLTTDGGSLDDPGRIGGQAGRLGVWLPEPMVLADASLPCTWSLTSDALAVWLAMQCRADALEVHKACEPSAALRNNATALAEAGIVDPLFPAMIDRAGRGLEWRVAGPGGDHGPIDPPPGRR